MAGISAFIGFLVIVLYTQSRCSRTSDGFNNIMIKDNLIKILTSISFVRDLLKVGINGEDLRGALLGSGGTRTEVLRLLLFDS